MHTILIIIPYFGPFPNYFNLWLKSCEFNSTINWLVYTDQSLSEYDIPNNVFIRQTTLEEMKKKLQTVFDFHISLDTPYKLCDYRPAFGEVFSKEISGYDFWGYGDIDLIYGNIRHFITEDLLHTYDRIFACGHLSVCRNENRVNSVYRKRIEDCFCYKDVFKSPRNWTFDEFGQGDKGGFCQICLNSGIKLFNKVLYADIDIRFNRLLCDYGGSAEERKLEHQKKKVFFEFSKGTLTQHWNNDDKGKEVAYIHLQKRSMKSFCTNSDNYFIYPNCFTKKQRISFGTLGFNPTYIKLRWNQIRGLIKRKTGFK